MNVHTVTLIPGDGIGIETSRAMQEVVSAAGVDINWQIAHAGEAMIEKYGTPMPAETLDSIRETKVAIKGPVTTPVGKGFRSVNVQLRQELDLYACVRPVLSIPGAGGRYSDVNLVIIRENTEDLYAGIEFDKDTEAAAMMVDFCEKHVGKKPRTDSAFSIKPISVTGSNRIARYAFDYAVAQNRSRVCAIHKANIMKFSDGLFLECAKNVAGKYPQIGFSDQIVDAFCMNMVIDPSGFDVVVLPNLYGDIASDLGAGLVGGLGIAPGANIGDDYAVFEAVHGSAPDIAGKDLANPTAQILSAAMMLDHLGENAAAAKIRNAISSVYQQGSCITADIVRANRSDIKPSSCTQFTNAVIAKL